jgi:hypothetical protein
MIGLGAVWAFLGLPGLREIALVVLVALVLYGRSGLRSTQYVRAPRLWLAACRRPVSPPTPGRPARGSKLEDRAFWVLAITAATAVAAWIVTRMMIVSGPGPAR